LSILIEVTSKLQMFLFFKMKLFNVVEKYEYWAKNTFVQNAMTYKSNKKNIVFVSFLAIIRYGKEEIRNIFGFEVLSTKVITNDTR